MFSGVATSRDNDACTTSLPPVCYTIHNLRGTIIRYVQSLGSSPRSNGLTRSSAVMTAKKQTPVPSVFIARGDCRIFQRGCQQPPTLPIFEVTLCIRGVGRVCSAPMADRPYVRKHRSSERRTNQLRCVLRCVVAAEHLYILSLQTR